MTLAAFMVAFGLGPILLAPLSESIGRAMIYKVCFFIFGFLQVGSALVEDIISLIILRFFSGFFGSASIACGGGSISDLLDANHRVRAMGWYVLGPLIGPTVGPIIGGFIAEISWRWIFWILAILSFINSAVAILFLEESYGPMLLAKKAKRIAAERKIKTQSAFYDSRTLRQRIYRGITRPIRILFTQPIVFSMAIYMALIYGTLYLTYLSLTYIYVGTYGFPTGLVGLTYLGLGTGFLISVFFGIPQVDRIYKKKTAANNGVALPEFRLPMANIGGIMSVCSMIIYGWTTEKAVFWIIPIIFTIPYSLAMILIFNSTQNYFIDAYIRYAASAIAAGAIFRAVVGSILPTLGPKMFDKLGYGWSFTLLAMINVVLLPLPPIFMIYGPKIRARFPMNLD